MNIAFVLLTHNPDEPAGIERSLASLAQGLRELGHRTVIIAAGPATPEDDPDLLRLKTLTLPRPALEDDLHALLADPEPARAEVRRLLAAHRAELVCWTDAVWGLGYLNPAPADVRTALMVHVLRTDEPMLAALAHRPAAVLTPSAFLRDQATDAGLDTGRWSVLPNALLQHAGPPGSAERERLRRDGPVRIVARAEPHKGTAELLTALPAALPGGLGRKLEIVLAPAGFEYWPGMQEQTIAECRALAGQLPEVRLLPALPWRQVQPFLAGAAVTVIASTSPETFGNVAAEALSVGTPVTGYDLGHLPALTGPAGLLVPLADGPERLWHTVAGLLADQHAYHAASRAAPSQVAGHTPAAVARAFLDATLRREP
ncbi:glycosyltransferase family 4 protein [Streptomyces sp. DSM 44917]|uniref:Glycosyltransferase family 4 protein n=1 Tax=Streptomyces boetiae TaxID=3075541 RepID=A0ABU2L830_9ACTN|nr:glycosyltransferase family 4 protein [Streptomyces sp. DSM 44917]MDT0307650.1 glycosyltransferase family 4 protein [Streptomyces sp. DSM 44917]